MEYENVASDSRGLHYDLFEIDFGLHLLTLLIPTDQWYNIN